MVVSARSSNSGVTACLTPMRRTQRAANTGMSRINVWIWRVLAYALFNAESSERTLSRQSRSAGVTSQAGARRTLPAGYRRAGSQAIRVDLAEKLFRAAHESRAAAKHGKGFQVDPALAESLGAHAIAFVKERSWVMQAPTGHRFCVVQKQRERFGPHLNRWD